MRVIHSLGESNFEGEVLDPSFIMGNKISGFCWLNANNSKSRYNGVYFSENNKIFKVIEDVQTGETPSELKNNFWSIEKKYDKEISKFFMPDKKNIFCCEYSKKSSIFLDFREPYSGSQAKYFFIDTGSQIDVTIDYEGEKYYLVIRYSGQFTPASTTVKKYYEYDRNRNSHPDNRDVFYLGDFEGGKILFSFSAKPEEAEKNSKLFNKTKILEQAKKTRVTQKKNPTNTVEMAYAACKIQLDNLADQNGLFAGFPWFFQYWSRDELISLRALKSVDKEISRKILNNWIDRLTEKYLVESRRNYDNTYEGNSIDAPAWIIKRLEEFPALVKKNKEKLKNLFDSINEFVFDSNDHNWMDSIQRKKPIEIQAMRLYLLNLAFKLTGEGSYKETLEKLKEKTREFFFRNGWLHDAEDMKIRPNIFIVYYFYPELFSNKEWEQILDNEIPELWTNWGGFSTISVKDPLFVGSYTGETPGSYHNGDSWFWINNLAGICLYDLNKKKYKEYIEKILVASTKEILFLEAVGNHSELSSFKELRAEGAPCQAFSAAMFIEFVDKIRKG